MMNTNMHQVGQKFSHTIHASVEGRAGEVKTIEMWASEPGRLLLFRGLRLDADDTSRERGGGTVLLDMEYGGKMDPWSESVPTSRILPNRLTRGTNYGLLHPRLSVRTRVEFLEDCTWYIWMHGDAVEVREEGVYAIVPKTPCLRDLPSRLADLSRDVQFNGGRRCDHCWFPYEDHAKWPWRLREYPAIEVVEAGKSADVVIPAENLIVTNLVQVNDYWRSGWHFVAAGFALAGSQEFTDAGGFTYYKDFLVPRGDSLLFRLANKTTARQTFEGKVVAHERVGA